MGGVTSIPMIIGNIAGVFLEAIKDPGKAIKDALNYAIIMRKKDPRTQMSTVSIHGNKLLNTDCWESGTLRPGDRVTEDL